MFCLTDGATDGNSGFPGALMLGGSEGGTPGPG